MTPDERPDGGVSEEELPAWVDRPASDGDERGQAHTLEGVIASLVVFAAVIFALEMTAVTPLSASTSNQHLENQHEATARGILAAAADNGSLKPTILRWNETGCRFFNASVAGYHTSDPPPTAFGAMLNRSFDRRGIAYNVKMEFTRANESCQPWKGYLVYQGAPSDNAVRASWTVTLYDGDRLYNHSGEPRNVTLADPSSAYFANDTAPSRVYNVVRVEVVVWRI